MRLAREQEQDDIDKELLGGDGADTDAVATDADETTDADMDADADADAEADGDDGDVKLSVLTTPTKQPSASPSPGPSPAPSPSGSVGTNASTTSRQSHGRSRSPPPAESNVPFHGEQCGLKAVLESGARCRSGTVIVGGGGRLGDAHEGDEADEADVLTDDAVVSINLSSATHDVEPLRRFPAGLVNRQAYAHLAVLDLSGNKITQLEHLHMLPTSLHELRLGRNQLKSLSPIGCEALANLRVLDVSGNLVGSIPSSIKHLKVLEELDLSGNALTSLDDTARLKPLANLITLKLASNPLCKVAHFRPFVVHSLRTLAKLDHTIVTEKERKQALTRFGALSVREEGLERKVASSAIKMSKQQMEMERLAVENKRLQEQLLMKNQILDSKTKNLTDAVGQLSVMEQSMSLFAIDNPEAADVISSLARTHDTDEGMPPLERGATTPLPSTTAVALQAQQLDEDDEFHSPQGHQALDAEPDSPGTGPHEMDGVGAMDDGAGHHGYHHQSPERLRSLAPNDPHDPSLKDPSSFWPGLGEGDDELVGMPSLTSPDGTAIVSRSHFDSPVHSSHKRAVATPPREGASTLVHPGFDHGAEIWSERKQPGAMPSPHVTMGFNDQEHCSAYEVDDRPGYGAAIANGFGLDGGGGGSRALVSTIGAEGAEGMGGGALFRNEDAGVGAVAERAVTAPTALGQEFSSMTGVSDSLRVNKDRIAQQQDELEALATLLRQELDAENGTLMRIRGVVSTLWEQLDGVIEELGALDGSAAAAALLPHVEERQHARRLLDEKQRLSAKIGREESAAKRKLDDLCDLLTSKTEMMVDETEWSASEAVLTAGADGADAYERFDDSIIELTAAIQDAQDQHTRLAMEHDEVRREIMEVDRMLQFGDKSLVEGAGANGQTYANNSLVEAGSGSNSRALARLQADGLAGSGMEMVVADDDAGGLPPHEQHALVPLRDLFETNGVLTRFMGELPFDYKARVQQYLWCARVYEERQQDVVHEINSRIDRTSDKQRELTTAALRIEMDLSNQEAGIRKLQLSSMTRLLEQKDTVIQEQIDKVKSLTEGGMGHGHGHQHENLRMEQPDPHEPQGHQGHQGQGDGQSNGHQQRRRPPKHLRKHLFKVRHKLSLRIQSLLNPY